MSSPDEIDGGEGVVEEIDIGALTPSSFYQNNLSKKVIDYTKFVENTWVNLEETSISDLPLLNNSGIADQVEPFCKEFATVERSDIFTNVPNLVADFGGYLCQCVVGKTSYQVAVQWPPLIPKIHPSIPSFLVLLARILKRTDDTFKFYYFMIAGFYQNIWTQKTCLQNQILISVCRCHTGKKEKDSWAIIDRDRNFYLYDIDNKKCVEKTTCQLTKCYSSTDKKTINILDVASRVACKFTPFEKEQIQLWDLIYSRQKVPFPFYFSSAAEVFPDIMYRAFYYTITSNDTIIPHAIMKTDMFYPEIWESLIKCFS